MNSFREWASTSGARVVLICAAAALLLCAWSLRNALRADEVVASASTVTIVSGALDTPPPPSSINVAVAVDADLFAPERKAPAARYRMPGEAAPKSVVEPPKPVVLGTAIAADGSSFATCQYQSARLLMVRVGDKVGDYTVKLIERSRVVFATPAGRTIEVLAPRAGS